MRGSTSLGSNVGDEFGEGEKSIKPLIYIIYSFIYTLSWRIKSVIGWPA